MVYWLVTTGWQTWRLPSLFLAVLGTIEHLLIFPVTFNLASPMHFQPCKVKTHCHSCGPFLT